MPDLSTSLHLDMLNTFRTKRRFVSRLRQAARTLFSPDIYGLQWGDPETVAPLRFVRNRYVLPYLNSRHVGVEIGPGGGRWTRDLLAFRALYVVDYYAELLAELRKHYDSAFSDNTSDKMRRMVATAGYRILEEDLTTLWHSSIVRFTP